MERTQGELSCRQMAPGTPGWLSTRSLGLGTTARGFKQPPSPNLAGYPSFGTRLKVYSFSNYSRAHWVDPKQAPGLVGEENHVLPPRPFIFH